MEPTRPRVTYKLPYGFMPLLHLLQGGGARGRPGLADPDLAAAGLERRLPVGLLPVGRRRQVLAANNTLVGSIDAYRQIRYPADPGHRHRRHRRHLLNRGRGRRSAGWPPRTSASPWPATRSTPRSRGRTRASSTCRPRSSGSRRSTASAAAMPASTSPASAGRAATTIRSSRTRWVSPLAATTAAPTRRAGAKAGSDRRRHPCARKTSTLFREEPDRLSGLLGLQPVGPSTNTGPTQVVLNVDGVTDKLYFTPDADSYAKPGGAALGGS